MYRKLLTAVMVVAGVVAFTLPTQADSKNDNRHGKAIPKVYGKTIGNWGHAWWQWAANFPTADLPLLQNGEVDCSAGQSGKVWYLAGNFGGFFGEANPAARTCSIKKGKAIFFPLFNIIVWTPEDCTDEPSCRDFADGFIDPIASWTCTVDNIPCVWSAQIVRAQSDARPLNLPAGSFPVTDLGYTAGVRAISIADGYWVMLDPLPPGKHPIHFTSDAPGFSLKVTYDLTVVDDDNDDDDGDDDGKRKSDRER